jgi:hypothetical protein
MSSCRLCCADPSHVVQSQLLERLEPAVDHALAVERQVRHLVLQAGSAITLVLRERDGGTVQPRVRWIKPVPTRGDVTLAAAESKLRGRIAKRATAARMALPFVREILFDDHGPLPKGIKKLSIPSVVEHFAKQTTESVRKNAENRVLRASLPVLHMTLGFETAELDWFYDFMWKPEIGRQVLDTAVECAQALSKSSRRSFRNASLIDLRLV